MGRKGTDIVRRAHVAGKSLMQFMGEVEDPRQRGKVKYPLAYVLSLLLLGLMYGKTSCTAIAYKLRLKRKYIKRVFGIAEIPSHDTFSEVLARLDFEELLFVFLQWIEQLLSADPLQEAQVMVDGKAVRASAVSDGMSTYIPYVLNAIINFKGVRLFIGMLPVGEKSNEIPHVVPLMELLEMRGKTFSADAIACQTKITRRVGQLGGHYVIPLKENQEGTLQELSYHLEACLEDGGCSHHGPDWDVGHGRIEARECWAAPIGADELAAMDVADDWRGIRTVARVHRRTTEKKTDKVSEQTVYYISSHSLDAQSLSFYVRNYWSVESCHWVLDSRYREDWSTSRRGNALENFALLRRIAFNLDQIEQRSVAEEILDFGEYFSEMGHRTLKLLTQAFAIL